MPSRRADVIGIAQRSDCRKAVHRAAQDDGDEARVAALRRVREAGHVGPGRQRAGSAEQSAAREGGCFAEIAHALACLYLRWNSGDIMRIARPCTRLSARETACRVSGDAAGAEHRVQYLVGIRSPFILPHCAATSRRVVHALGGGPGLRAVGPAVRPGRVPERLSHRVERPEHDLYVGHAPVARTPATAKSSGVRIFVSGVVHASGASTSARVTALRSPSVSLKTLASRSTSAGGGSSATKWRASLRAMNRAVAGMARKVDRAPPRPAPSLRRNRSVPSTVCGRRARAARVRR